MMKNLFVVFTLLIFAPCTSIAKPTNYDECILENIRALSDKLDVPLVDI